MAQSQISNNMLFNLPWDHCKCSQIMMKNKRAIMKSWISSAASVGQKDFPDKIKFPTFLIFSLPQEIILCFRKTIFLSVEKFLKWTPALSHLNL